MNIDLPKAKKIILGLAITSMVLCLVVVFFLVKPSGKTVVMPTTQAVPETKMVSLDFGQGYRFEAPADGIVEFEGNLADIKTPTKHIQSDSANAKGISFAADGDASKMVLTLKFDLPETSIPGGPKSVAGYANLGVKMLFTSGPTPLYIIGGICIVIGSVLGFWLKQWKIGLGFIVGGVGIIAVSMLFTQYPWTLWLLFLIGLAVVGILIWDYMKKHNVEQANGTIVTAAEQLPAKIKALFTKLVSAEAAARGNEKTVKKVVTDTKMAEEPRAVSVDINPELRELKNELATAPTNP